MFSENIVNVLVIFFLLPLFGWICIFRTYLRGIVLIFGLIFLFQSTYIPGFIQNTYVFSALCIAVASFFNVQRRMKTLPFAVRKSVKRILLGILTFLVIPFASLFGYMANPSDGGDYLRDALTYCLIPIFLIVGLDWGLSISSRKIRFVAIGAGLIGALSMSVAWLERRGRGTFELEQFGLASSFVTFPGFALCLAMYFGAGRKISWLLLALLQASIIIVSGGRQSLVIFALAILLSSLLASGNLRTKVRKWMTAIVAALFAAWIIVATSSSIAGGIFLERFSFFAELLTGGTEVLAEDGSAVHRTAAYTSTLEMWMNSLYFGRGFGHSFVSVRTNQIEEGLLTLDTPFVILAKVGIFGTAVLIVAFFLTFWMNGSKVNLGIMGRHYRGISIFLMLLTVPNGFPTENRGFPIFALFVVAVTVAAVLGKAKIAPTIETKNRRQFS